VGDPEWETALVLEDTRKDYGERRFRVLGTIGELLYAVAVTPRSGGIRVISLRRANHRGSGKDMRKRPTRADQDNPARTEEGFRRARPAVDVLPTELAAVLPRRRGQRGPQRDPAKQLVSLRIDRDVVARFRTGDGWQTRVNEALRQAARRLD
jgi:uncharacterized protein (DUF4415 family)